ncbi:dipeptidase E [Kribbella amoyensis]|uniref:Dipeptidase E n=1 Tax=Kribbella amoyensis TaxID=996641 RepID=A0A561BX87_9ACTN|nr:Type 1 glutamine amidotransferase-like domain-containing protein [Kribbella amoyensis]TWD83504.1 dipeptidase E [Kribbella amoyensis]
MKLYLSSFRLGDHPEHLVALLPPAARIAVICNALDSEDAVLRAEKVTAELEWLTDLGLRPEGVDLRECSPEDVAARLTQYDGLWVRGGNVFVLRVALARSGADKVLPELIRSEQLVYAGYSAGPCVLAPSLRGLELCDDVTAVDGEPIWDGLGLLDEAIVPHLDSPGHPETELVEKVRASYERTGVPYLPMRDGQAYVVDGDRRELV